MTPDVLRAVVAPFFAADPAPLYASSCCGRLYVGREPATMCRTCPKIPEPVQIGSLDDVDQAAAKIT